jgi:pyruvate ferredoxin oxidoreductase alpha subunit
MTVANRAIGAPINIWNDHSDAMSQRDAGWLQLYAETSQEALDLHIQAFRIAEELSVPVIAGLVEAEVARMSVARRSGPSAENILRDLGITASRIG